MQTNNEIIVNAIISFKGRLDAVNSSVYEEKLNKLLENTLDNLTFDLDELEYLSSSGLRIMLVAAKKLASENKKIKLCALKPHIKEVLSISGLISLFEIKEKLSDCL